MADKKRGGPMKPGPFKRLCDEAKLLGIDTEGIEPGDASDLQNRVEAAKREAREADSKIKADPDVTTEHKLATDADGVVLVRIAEWTDWIPSKPSDHLQQLNMHDGFSGVAAGKNERLLEVGVSGTGQNKVVKRDGEDVQFGLYAFQALFAQQIGMETYTHIKAAQGGPDFEEAARTKKGDLIIPGK